MLKIIHLSLSVHGGIVLVNLIDEKNDKYFRIIDAGKPRVQTGLGLLKFGGSKPG